ncbi:hypothetical protein, partial [Pseudomonas aeruginosa]
GNNLTITKALLKVLAEAKTKANGTADPRPTSQVRRLKNGGSPGALRSVVGPASHSGKQRANDTTRCAPAPRAGS